MLRKISARLSAAVMGILVAYAVFNILDVRGKLRQAEDYRSRLAAEIAVLTRENERLEQEIAAAEDSDVVRRIAGQKLGLVMPGEVIFRER